MPSLQTFLDKHGIDIDALALIKHRVFVVGRFNRREVSPEKPPEVYLFTNRPAGELAELYKNLFTKLFGLNFENFVKALQPAIAEEIEQGQIPAVIQQMPSQDGTEEGSVVIDKWNFFFLRAIANSQHPAFQEDLSSVAREILREGEKDPGRGIYLLIRKNLNSFCRFQPRTSELINAFSSLLESVARLHGLPPYAQGGPLPGGFLEKFVDFLYSADLTTDFSIEEGMDLSGVWEPLRDRKAKTSFVKVVNTFRNALLGLADEYPGILVAGGQTIYAKARELLGRRDNLLTEFKDAREAYNGLAQIVRSKVLLSMVLDWVFRAHYEIEDVKKLADKDEQDMKVERLVLGKEFNSGVAKPIPRATADERDRFKTALTDGMEKLILAVIASEGKVEGALKALPDELRKVAESLRSDPVRGDLIRRMAMTSGDPLPFIKSQKTILVDVLLPVLYQAPTLSLYELRELFRHEVQAAYLTAVTLDDKYQGIVGQIAKDFLPTWVQNIDKRTRAINQAEKMRDKLLEIYLNRIASKDFSDRIVEAQELIRRSMTVLENVTPKPGETRGVSTMTPIFTTDARSAVLTFPSQRVSEAVGRIAVDIAQKSIQEPSESDKVTETVEVEEAEKLAGALAGAQPGPTATARSAAGTTDRAHDEVTRTAAGDGERAPLLTEEKKDPPDGLRQDIQEMVAAFLGSSEPEQRNEKEIFLRDVATKAEGDPGLVKKARDAMRGFHQVLKETYSRYREKQEMKFFVGSVERMTLANLMLVNQEALSLGKACSNLYAMLLDVVENMDSVNPEPKDFISKFSLTKYFDNDVLEKKDREKSGITDLRQTLRRQAHESLKNTVDFISELRGIKYLMDRVSSNARAEIVVVNATAEEFREWVAKDNLAGGGAVKAMLRGAFIKDAAQSTACPGLVYMTDSAFPGGGKAEWLESLTHTETMPLREGEHRFVLPPLLLSTGVQDNDGFWIKEGKSLADVAEPKAVGRKAVPAPVVIVGPSPYMNRRGDVFGTYLPAGYVFAAHFLHGSEQRVANPGVQATDAGRFRVIGAGIGQIGPTVDRILWGGTADDSYAFSVDFYLYIVLTVLASARNLIRPATGMPKAAEFFPFFTGHRTEGIKRTAYMTTKALDGALLNTAEHFALGQDVSQTKLEDAFLVNEDGSELHITDVRWFNQALEKADLPRSGAS